MFPHHRRCRLDHECTPEITRRAWKDGHCWRLVAGAVPAQKQGTGKEDYVRETARPGSSPRSRMQWRGAEEQSTYFAARSA